MRIQDKKARALSRRRKKQPEPLLIDVTPYEETTKLTLTPRARAALKRSVVVDSLPDMTAFVSSGRCGALVKHCTIVPGKQVRARVLRVYIECVSACMCRATISDELT